MRRVRALVIGVLVVTSACGGAPESSEQPTLTVELTDYALSAAPGTVPAGHVVFAVRNRSSMAHELPVLRTDLAPNALPMENGKAKEDGKAGGLPNIAGGVSRKLVLELPAGRYVLICNVVGHYQLGMRAALTAE